SDTSTSVEQLPTLLSSRRFQVQRRHQLRQIVGGMEIVLGRGHLHGLTEDLQTVAIGIEEVDAFGEKMVRRKVHLDTVVFELLIELAQLCFPTLDLQRRVA